MPANRRRQINALPGLKLLLVFFGGAVLLLSGLGYVYCQNELHRLLGEVGKLERDLQQLRTMTEVVDVNITKLSSKQELKKKQDNNFFKLTPITGDRIVVVGAPAKDLRPVSNQKATP
jgi:cell division protein FtsL